MRKTGIGNARERVEAQGEEGREVIEGLVVEVVRVERGYGEMAEGG